VRLALKVVIQNDGDCVEVILRYPLNKKPRWPQIRSRHIAEHNTSPLRSIFGRRRDKVTGDWRKLHSDEPNDLYCSPNILQVIKSRRMRWVGHVARMGEGRRVYEVFVGKP
jgi:hypothetical protein